MKKDYIKTRRIDEVIAHVQKGWHITSQVVVAWKEPDQDGVVRAVEIEYILEKETGHGTVFDFETK